MKFIKDYEKFLSIWGYEAQARMCIEEMSELTKELCKLERYKHDEEKKKQIIENIKEEISDVMNTVEQMAYYYGLEDIEKIREQKIAKTIKRLG